MLSVINSVCVFKVERFFPPRLQRIFNMKSGRETQRTFVDVVKWEMVGVTGEDTRDRVTLEQIVLCGKPYMEEPKQQEDKMCILPMFMSSSLSHRH